MAMPRPSGRIQKIAEAVIPGLSAARNSKKRPSKKKGQMSEVEVEQTTLIERK